MDLGGKAESEESVEACLRARGSSHQQRQPAPPLTHGSAQPGPAPQQEKVRKVVTKRNKTPQSAVTQLREENWGQVLPRYGQAAGDNISALSWAGVLGSSLLPHPSTLASVGQLGGICSLGQDVPLKPCPPEVGTSQISLEMGSKLCSVRHFRAVLPPLERVRSGWKGWCRHLALLSPFHPLSFVLPLGRWNVPALPGASVQQLLLRGHPLALLQIQPQIPAQIPAPNPSSYLCSATQGPGFGGQGCPGRGRAGCGSTAVLPVLCLCCLPQAGSSHPSCKNLHVMGRRHRKVAWWPWGDIQVTPAVPGQAGLW